MSDQQTNPDLPERIAAERVYLRPYRPGDGPLLYQISQRNLDRLGPLEAAKFLLALESESQAEQTAQQIFQAWNDRTLFILGVFRMGSDEFLGQIYLGPTRKHPLELEVGFMADVRQQGRGFITEALRAALAFAFQELDASRVYLECADSNHRSWAVAERCGMIRKAHLQEDKHLPDGSLQGTYHYSLDREEWPPKLKKKPDSWTL